VGNRLKQNAGSNQTPTEWANYQSTGNQMTSNNFSPGANSLVNDYDADGRLTNDGSKQYVWQADGHLCEVETAANTYYQYVFDPEGHRVTTGTRGDFNCDLGITTLTDFIVDGDGQQVTEVSGAGAWKHTNIYANGALLATYDPSGLHFALADWQGTKRVQASPIGIAELDCWNLPFNDEFGCTPGDAASEHHYTGKEHDPYTGLDLFGARDYTGYSGRFLSPDFNETGDGPDPVPYADFENPQSLNLYSYVKNNPLSRTDANGHATLCGPDTWNPQTNTLTAGSCVNLPDPETGRQVVRQWVYQHTTTAPPNQQVPRMVSSNSNSKWDPLSLLYGVGGTLSPKAKETLDKLRNGEPLPDGQRAGAKFGNNYPD